MRNEGRDGGGLICDVTGHGQIFNEIDPTNDDELLVLLVFVDDKNTSSAKRIS